MLSSDLRSRCLLSCSLAHFLHIHVHIICVRLLHSVNCKNKQINVYGQALGTHCAPCTVYTGQSHSIHIHIHIAYMYEQRIACHQLVHLVSLSFINMHFLIDQIRRLFTLHSFLLHSNPHDTSIFGKFSYLVVISI